MLTLGTRRRWRRPVDGAQGTKLNGHPLTLETARYEAERAPVDVGDEREGSGGGGAGGGEEEEEERWDLQHEDDRAERGVRGH
eukprot:407758-Prorocentrum_minimum.AAC.1